MILIMEIPGSSKPDYVGKGYIKVIQMGTKLWYVELDIKTVT